MMSNGGAPKRDVEQSFRAFMQSKRGVFSLLAGPASELSAELRDLRIQAAAIEAQLCENEDKVLLAHVRRRFGESTADAVAQSAASELRIRSAGAGDDGVFRSAASSFSSAEGGSDASAAANGPQAGGGADASSATRAGGSCTSGLRGLHARPRTSAGGAQGSAFGSHPWGEGAKVGLAAAAGGTALLVLASGIPVLAIGVGLALVGGSAGAATSHWRRQQSRSPQPTPSEVAGWRAHVALLQDKLARSEALTASALAPASLATLAGGSGAGPCGIDASAAAPPPPGAHASAGAGLGGGKAPHGPQASQPAALRAPPAQAAGAAAGAGLGGAGAGAPGAAQQVPALLADAFGQVRCAMVSGRNEWRLRACYGGARLLEHVHAGGQAPLCAVKAIVQVDAPPRSVRKMVLDLREGRRLWDASFEHGHCVDTLSAHSDVAHIVLSSSAHSSPYASGHTGALVPLLLMSTGLTAERDLLVWRHWVPLPPDLAAEAADGTASAAPAAAPGRGDHGYLVVTTSTLHAACAPVHGYARAACLLEAWVITPVAFSVRSELTHFCSLELTGWPGALARLSPSMRAALHRPFFERLGALALHATATHGCLAVALPRRVKTEGDAGGEGEEEEGGEGGACRSYDEVTGLAAGIFQPVPEIEWQLRTAPTIGGVDGFSQPKAEVFRVRSKGYLADRLKLPSAPAAFDVAAVYAFRMHEVVRHVAAAPDSPLHRWRASGTMPAFTLIINMVVAGSPGFQGVFFFGMDEEEWSVHLAAREAMEAGRPPASPSEAFHRLLARFIRDDFSAEANRFRDTRFKLLPAIVQGPMLLKNSSGNRPAILGTKLKQSYFAGPGYFEVDVDCASSHAAASVVNMVKGYCKTLVIDLAFILQGDREDELPERVLSVIRFSRVDMGKLVLRPSGDAVPSLASPR